MCRRDSGEPTPSPVRTFALTVERVIPKESGIVSPAGVNLFMLFAPLEGWRHQCGRSSEPDRHRYRRLCILPLVGSHAMPLLTVWCQWTDARPLLPAAATRPTIVPTNPDGRPKAVLHARFRIDHRYLSPVRKPEGLWPPKTQHCIGRLPK